MLVQEKKTNFLEKKNFFRKKFRSKRKTQLFKSKKKKKIKN